MHPAQPASIARRALLLTSLAAPAMAQASWPERPVRWIINFPPGGAADILSRILAEYFGNRFGQPIVVENRPGAGGMVGADIVAKARGDAHTVMISSASSHGIGPVLYRNVPYDPLADFTHVHLVGSFPSVLAVNGESPMRDFADFMAQARRGGMVYATGGNGTMNHLVGQLLKQETGIELTHVPYRGSAAAMTDVIAGQVPCVMESLPTALGHFRGGRLRPIAQSEDTRDSTLADVPTFQELGLPGVTSSNWFGFSLPAGVPGALVERWDAALKEALAAPAVQQRLAGIGVRPGTLGPDGYTALITSELTRWRQVIRANGIQAD